MFLHFAPILYFCMLLNTSKSSERENEYKMQTNEAFISYLGTCVPFVYLVFSLV